MKCPNCGGNIIYEEFGRYSRLYTLSNTGATDELMDTWDDTEDFSYECEDCGEIYEPEDIYNISLGVRG